MITPTLDTVAALSLLALTTAWGPGPNNFLLASSGATFGLQRTIPHILGVAIGFTVMLFAVSLGLGNIFRTMPGVAEVMSWAAAAIMVALAWRIATQALGKATSAAPLTFGAAAGFQWINPKAWAMAIVAASSVTGLAPFAEAAVASGIFLVVILGSTTAWAAFGAALSHFLGNGVHIAIFNGTMGALLAICGVWLVVGT